MKNYLLILMTAMLLTTAHAQEPNNKQAVALWYEAFDKHDPALVDKILSKDWIDIPPMPGQVPGPAGAKQVLAAIQKTFPDFRITIKDVLQDGNKVVVRSEITATQLGEFEGLAATGRRISIMAIDIHEFKDGKIVRTWHMEDWMSGLHQLGYFDKR